MLAYCLCKSNKAVLQTDSSQRDLLLKTAKKKKVKVNTMTKATVAIMGMSWRLTGIRSPRFRAVRYSPSSYSSPILKCRTIRTSKLDLEMSRSMAKLKLKVTSSVKVKKRMK